MATRNAGQGYEGESDFDAMLRALQYAPGFRPGQDTSGRLMENAASPGNPFIIYDPNDPNTDPRLLPYLQQLPDGRMGIPSNMLQTAIPEAGKADHKLIKGGPLAAMGALGGYAGGLYGGGGGLESLSGGVGDTALMGGAGADTLGATGLEGVNFTPDTFQFGQGFTGGSVPVGGGMSVGASTIPAAATPAASSGGLLGGLNNALGTKITGGSLLSGALQGGLGLLGANQQAGALDNLANTQSQLGQQYLGIGAPYRDLLQQSYQPGFDITQDPAYQNALQSTQDSFLRAASAGRAPGVSAGNPMDNPQAWAETMKYVNSNLALPYQQNYRSQIGQFGGLGLGNSSNSFSNASNIGMQGAQAQSGGLDALGFGVGTALNPQPSLADLFKNFKLSLA